MSVLPQGVDSDRQGDESAGLDEVGHGDRLRHLVRRQRRVTDMELSFDVHEERGVPVLAVGGEIDVYTAPRLRERLLDLAHSGKATIVADLTEVSFVDSTGLGVLVSGLKRFREAGGDLLLVVTQPQILKVLEITGLTTVFSIHPTVAEALTG